VRCACLHPTYHWYSLRHPRRDGQAELAGVIDKVRNQRAVCVAVVALQYLRRTDDVSADLEEMETEMTESEGGGGAARTGVAPEEVERLNRKDEEAAPKKLEDKQFTIWDLLRSPQLRLPLFIAMFLQVIQQLSGINAVMLRQRHLHYSATELSFC